MPRYGWDRGWQRQVARLVYHWPEFAPAATVLGVGGKFVQSTISSFYKKRKRPSKSDSPRKMPAVGGVDIEMTSRSGANTYEGGVTTEASSNVIKFGGRTRKISRYTKGLQALGRKLDNVQIPVHATFQSTVSSTYCQPQSGMKQNWGHFLIANKSDLEAIYTDADAVDQIGETVVGKGAGWADTRYLVKNCAWELTMVMDGATMSANTPMIVDIYFLRCRRDDENISGQTLGANILDASTVMGKYGASADSGGSTITIGGNPNVTPYDVNYVTRYFTIGRHEQYMMSQGKTVTLNGITKFNKVYRKDNWSDVQSFKAGWTEAILFTVRSADYATGAATPSGGRVNFYFSKTFRWKPLVNNHRATGTVYTIM